MKKIILPLLLFPLAVFAQSNVPLQKVYNSMIYPAKMDQDNKGQSQPIPATPVKAQSTQADLSAFRYTYNPTQIGTTTYDLQTNGSLAKRLQLYSGGKLSYVWIKSDKKDNTYPIRYTGYNSFNGSAWTVDQNSFTPIEFDRSGWPNIGALTNTSGNQYEVLTSHYAAAGSNSYAGGIYWYANSGIGKTDFTKIIDNSNNRALTQGLLWPRMATSGSHIYLIGTYQNANGGVKKAGVKNPIVYFCYDNRTQKFLVKNITLPGYDSTRYAWGAADEYSLDARGPYVAVLMGGATNDLALWKSTDSGLTFKKTTVQRFPFSPYDYKVDPAFPDTTGKLPAGDTTKITSNDGACSVSLDNNGVAHISFSPTTVFNITSGDSGVNFQQGNNGIVYWNDNDKKFINVGGAFDYNHNGILDIPAGNFQTAQAAYSGHNLNSYSNIAVDAQGHIFVVYSAPHEQDIDPNTSNAFRHIYCAAFDGTKWHDPQDIAQSWGVEDAFGTVARDADNKLHLAFMQDDAPGIYQPGGASGAPTNDTMYYIGTSVADLLTDKVGKVNLGINSKGANDVFSTSTIYPNPADNNLNLAIDLKHNATVTVKVYSMLGQEMETETYASLPTGTSRLNIQVGKLPVGVYMCNITAGNYTTSQRIVIER